MEGAPRDGGGDSLRIKVLKRMARLNAAKAKELERMTKADANMPAMDRDSLFEVLRRIYNVMEWRFVDALGEVVLDADILTETCDAMVLANEMGSRPMELASGDLLPWDEVFQWYIVQDPSFIMEHTAEPVFRVRHAATNVRQGLDVRR